MGFSLEMASGRFLTTHSLGGVRCALLLTIEASYLEFASRWDCRWRWALGANALSWWEYPLVGLRGIPPVKHPFSMTFYLSSHDLPWACILTKDLIRVCFECVFPPCDVGVCSFFLHGPTDGWVSSIGTIRDDCQRTVADGVIRSVVLCSECPSFGMGLG